MAATMANLFAGNPMTTAVGHKIERATDSTLASEDWGLNMEICDMINSSEENCKDAARAIRKRLHNLAGKNFTGVMYTLTVLETCVKNCGRNFHALICQRDYVQDLIKLIGPPVEFTPPRAGDSLLSNVNSTIVNFAESIESAMLGPRYEPPLAVQEKTLSLVQSWAHAFRGQPDLGGVAIVYDELLAKGVQFPDGSDTPILTPGRSAPAPAPAAAPAPAPAPANAAPAVPPVPSSRPVDLTAQRTEKLQREVRVVDGNLQVLNEMLSTLKPATVAADDLQLLQHLAGTCRTMQQRIVALVGRVSDDKLTAELLRLNDELNNAFIRYERFERGRSGGGATTPDGRGPASSPSVSAAPAVSAGDVTLIDLGESGADQVSQQLAAMAMAGSATSALQRVPTAGEAPPPPYPAAPAGAAPNSILQQETDFDEMERWLNTASGAAAAAAADGAPAADGTLTNTEFDRFLAERAAATEPAPPKQ